jgi:hypothetical protein
MIQKDKFGYYEIICGECGETLDVDFDTFEEAVEYKKTIAKGEGWRAVKDKEGGWHDLCPDCATPEFIRKLKEDI